VGRDGGAYNFDLGNSRTEIFLQMGMDREIIDLPIGQINQCARNASRSFPPLVLFQLSRPDSTITMATTAPERNVSAAIDAIARESPK
jgi:hypothetical protein